jgi:hypothetical protein
MPLSTQVAAKSAVPTVRIDDAAIFRVIRTIAAFYPHGHGTHAAN